MVKKSFFILIFGLLLLFIINSNVFAYTDEDFGFKYTYNSTTDMYEYITDEMQVNGYDFECYIPSPVYTAFVSTLNNIATTDNLLPSNYYIMLIKVMVSGNVRWQYWAINNRNNSNLTFNVAIDSGGGVSTYPTSYSTPGHFGIFDTSNGTFSITNSTGNSNTRILDNSNWSYGGRTYSGWSYPRRCPLLSNKNSVTFNFSNGTSVSDLSFGMPTFINPTFDNYEDTTTWGSSLTTGEFYNLVFSGNSATSLDVIFLDNTYVNAGGEDVPSIEYNLTTTSQYYDSTTNKWTIPINDISIPYMNNHTYEIDLIWDNQGVQSNNYTWTTDFSPLVIADIEARGQQSLNNIDYFFTNTDVDLDSQNSFWEQLISASDFEFNSDTYLDSLFNILYQMFTDTEANDFVFTIPNSNGQTITIEADYIENKLPVSIISIIRMVYWFVIARFMFKDVFHIIDRIRQGYWFTESSDDIKTEVL